MVKIIFLGTGDAFCSGGRNMSGILVQDKGPGILLDCGPGALPRLNSKGFSTDDIDTILITHLHGDHFGGIPYILLEASRKRKRSHELLIVGPRSSETRTRRLYSELYPKEALEEPPFKIRFREVNPGEPLSMKTRRTTFQVIPFKAPHTPDSLSYRLRLDSGITVAYTGDTGWTKDLVTLMSKASIVIAECNFYDTAQPTHLNFQQIKELKKLAKVNAFVLIHLSEEMLRQKEYGNIDSCYIVPEDGDTLILKR
jgi:ribonuclease BN (tRNA processing enzyme)